MTSLPGIHHVTAIARDPQANVDFYVGVLGLRLVKRTVNFDDPQTYHLYYGDAEGSPGSILTFFPWPGARSGRAGTGQATVTSLSIPAGSVDGWAERLERHGVDASRSERFGETVLTLRDPDGLRLELVASSADGDLRPAWGKGVDPALAIRGIDGVTLTLRNPAPTEALLTDVMGFRPVVAGDGRTRFETGAGGSGTRVDLVADPSGAPGRVAAGSVHHVAWRVQDDAAQERWRSRLAEALQAPTDVKDRNYFHSIYFREPGGVLFELATDPPGFAVDEPVDGLGAELKLPSWLEPVRGRVEAALPPLRVPEAVHTGEPGGAG
ncbi:MAG: ring-cleaving dioxygenase [Acidobacteriota bacterium]